MGSHLSLMEQLEGPCRNGGNSHVMNEFIPTKETGLENSILRRSKKGGRNSFHILPLGAEGLGGVGLRRSSAHREAGGGHLQSFSGDETQM